MTREQIITGVICLIIGIIIGTFLFGPGWFVSQNCTHYPFLLVDPKLYLACKAP